MAIVTTGTPGTLAAMDATRAIPIVMASSADPVRSGIVASLARPGGNVTGFTILGPELEGKRMQLLKRAGPRLARVAVLCNPGSNHARGARTRRGGLPRRGAGERLRHDRQGPPPDALAVLAVRALLAHRRRIVEFATARRLPTMYPYGEYVDGGGLMSYAPSNIALFRGAATYVDRIIRGAKPESMPVQEPTKFELVINLKAAKTIRLTIPQSLLLEADRRVQ